MVLESDETIAEASLQKVENDESVKICAQCDSELDPAEWTPTVATMSDGVAVYLFCDGQCRDEWRSEGDS